MDRLNLLKHEIELVDIQEFKSYYKENIMRFSGIAQKSYLKAVDIPPAYFLEQPDTTKDILLDNKEERINSLSKYIGKCIVVLWKDGMIVNACRMSREEAELSYERLSTIEDVEGIVWNKTYYREGYLQGYIPVGKIGKEGYNKCLVIDFPILLNKPVTLHNAFFKMPNESSIVESDLFYYVASIDVDFNNWQHVALAIEDGIDNTTNSDIDSMDKKENSVILREHEEVLCQLVEEKVLPKNIMPHVLSYLIKNVEAELTVNKLTEIILSYEGNLRSIKHVNVVRDCYEYIYKNFTKPIEELIA